MPKNKFGILEDRSRNNNNNNDNNNIIIIIIIIIIINPVEGIPVSENEGWDVTEEKPRKVIEDGLYIKK